MEPGRLRHRVSLQGVTRTDDGGGGYTEAWGDLATVWAAVEPLQGSEQIRAMQTEAAATHRVRMRYRAGVHAGQRVIHEGRGFEIVAPPVDPDERHVELVLLAREVELPPEEEA